MTKLGRGLAITLALAMTLSASVTAIAADEPGPAGLVDIPWQLSTILADGESLAVPAEVKATLHLLAGEANGSGGCNRFFGAYEVDEARISFGPLGITQMLCEGPGQDVEDAYMAALPRVEEWWISANDSLFLGSEDRTVELSFVAGEAAEAPIEGQTWHLREQAVDGAPGAVPAEVLVSLRMDAGRATGTSGCNRYDTSYEIDGSSITFGAVAATLMACTGPAGEVEAAYLANLPAVASWATDGERLSFSDGDGTVVLVYEAAPAGTLVGRWVAIGINNGTGGVAGSRDTSSVTAEFSADGELSGFDGCNPYSTSYAVDGNAISISETFATGRAACASEELAERSRAYYAALTAATTWAVDDTGALQLRDDGGSLQVDYAAAEG